MSSIAGVIYLVIGVFVAISKGYAGTIDGFGDIVNLLLAITLWPLVLLGVKFNLRFGGGRDRNSLADEAAMLLGPPLVYGRAALSAIRAR